MYGFVLRSDDRLPVRIRVVAVGPAISAAAVRDQPRGVDGGGAGQAGHESDPDGAPGPQVRGGGQTAACVWGQDAVSSQNAGAPSAARSAVAAASLQGERAGAHGRDQKS